MKLIPEISEPAIYKVDYDAVRKRKPAPPPQKLLTEIMWWFIDVTPLQRPKSVEEWRRNTNPEYRIPDPTFWHRVFLNQHINKEFFQARKLRETWYTNP